MELFDQARGFTPAEEVEQHDAGEHDRAGVDDVLVGVLGRGAVGGLEDGEAIADVGAGRDAEAADLRGGGVGDVVAVEVGGGEDAVVLGADDDLLEDGVGDAVVDQDLLLPLAVAVRLADRGEDGLDPRRQSSPKSSGANSMPGSMSAAFCFGREVRVGLEVAEDPALALGDGLVAELLRGDFVAPLAEGALGELLDVALVDEGDGLAAVVDARTGWPRAPAAWCR